jgi:hypothetical protein
MKIFKIISVCFFILLGLLSFDFILYVLFNFTVFDLFSGVGSHLVTEDEVYKSVVDSMLKEKVVLSQKCEIKHDVHVSSG